MPKKGQIKYPPKLGERHYQLKIIGIPNEFSHGKHMVECVCICNKTVKIRLDCLRNGITKSCGCIRRLSIKGEIYGDLTAIDFAGFSRNNKSLWSFKCICGNIVIKDAVQVRARNVQLHCGCKKTPFKERIFKSLFAHYRNSAKNRGFVFELNLMEFVELTQANCFYCNQAPWTEIKTLRIKKPNVFYNGIDRYNNEIGYIRTNCVTCCKLCNAAKGAYSAEIFFDWIQKTFKNLQEKGMYER